MIFYAPISLKLIPDRVNASIFKKYEPRLRAVYDSNCSAMLLVQLHDKQLSIDAKINSQIVRISEIRALERIGSIDFEQSSKL